MTYAFIQDVPGDAALYAQIDELLPSEPPKGLVAHVAIAHDGGLRYVDVWDSEQDWVRFRDEHVFPAVETVLARHGIPHDVSVVQWQQIDVIDAKVGRAGVGAG